MSLFLIGRWLVGAGIIMAAAGLALMLGGRLGLGKLPGDFSFQRGSKSFYFPIATSLLLSIGLTIILNLFARWKR